MCVSFKKNKKIELLPELESFVKKEMGLGMSSRSIKEDLYRKCTHVDGRFSTTYIETKVKNMFWNR